MKEKNTGVLRLVLRVLQGMLIGVGAVLPGISGGVLCVVFGIYKPVMELLSSPVKKFKTHVPRLLPVIVGAALGFLGVAKVLAFFLEKYPDQSVCLFVGLIGGMLPSLFREAGEQGRTRGFGHHCVPGQGHQRAVHPFLQLCFPRHCGHRHRGDPRHHPLWELCPGGGPGGGQHRLPGSGCGGCPGAGYVQPERAQRGLTGRS